ncbi:Cold shock protein 1 [Stieleria maiorica]|uniref:Cold shock protein 1 n=1 Tax=Stieleria maiorica TaxID=2795974 RepID=A0A5B9MDP0_9BACT|nr:cold shock and DUF1294 domain-containing protein [Stieleria maiorica]QEF99372.1 Cold shock protein 1 [Stieleria maiorica]
MRLRPDRNGTIITWNDDKGYGFIATGDDEPDVFVHIRAFRDRRIRPEQGMPVTYRLSRDDQGRPRAAEAQLAIESADPPRRRAKTAVPVIVAWMFLVFVGLLVLTNQLPQLVLWVYLLASLATFVAYAFDKSAARSGRWRTKENTLHLMALIGGWPGAVIAQEKLRHKTRKQSFRIVFGLTVLLNGALLVGAMMAWSRL